MLLESTRLGELDIDDQSVIDMPGGLLGFDGLRKIVLVDADVTGAYVWVQSVDDPNLAFLAVAPQFFFPDYEPEVPDVEAREMGLDDEAAAQVLCLVTISESAITANLLGPIVLNVRDRIARQLVLADQGWTTTEPLGSS